MVDQPKQPLLEVEIDDSPDSATVEYLDPKLATFVIQLHEAIAQPPFAEEANEAKLAPLRQAALEASHYLSGTVDTVPPMFKLDSDATVTQSANHAVSSKNVPLAPPQRPDEIGRLDSYRILKKLGEGGMGVVFEAEDLRLERRVALKVMRPEVATIGTHSERFQREARIAAKVEHDHICPIYQVGEENSVPFIAMPFLKGEPLDAKIKREKPLEIDEAIRIGREIAEGLSVAHQAGLIHRDIKPANVFLETVPNRLPRVRILDFGLARLEADETHLTASGAVMGTPAYMSPEQGRGKSVDHRTDLFSLGVILYEMTTGKRPFTGSDSMSILTSLAVDEPTPPNELNASLPHDLSKLILRLLSKSPDRRPQSGQEVSDELLRIQTQTTSLVTAPDAKPREETRRFPRIVPMVLGLLFLLGGFSTYKLVFESKDGTLLVEVEGEEADVKFKNGKLEISDENGKLKYTLSPSEKNKTLPPGKYLVKVVSADGVKLETTEFEMERNGKAVLRVTVDPQTATKQNAKVDPTVDADRKAAEYVLSVGGRVRANGRDPLLRSVAELPKTAFRLTTVDLFKNAQVTEAGLAFFDDCRDVAYLNLFDTNVSDAGVAHFKRCKKLDTLGLRMTKVTDAGAAHFKGCEKLIFLDLSMSRVTDAGLVHFKDCARLENLQLYNLPVTDAGLALFKDCKNLNVIVLAGTRVTDAGVAEFKDRKGLKELYLSQTRVTPGMIDELKTALPQCRIEWDGGLIKPLPPKDADKPCALMREGNSFGEFNGFAEGCN